MFLIHSYIKYKPQVLQFYFKTKSQSNPCHLGDVQEFYKEAIDVRVPLDKLKDIELPKNISVQYEYHRFHPETDTMFGGVSAYPRQSTLVTGLTYKKKYAGYTAKPKWE